MSTHPRPCVLLLGAFPGQPAPVNVQVLDAIGAAQHPHRRLSAAWVDDVPARLFVDAQDFLARKMTRSAALILDDPSLCRLWPFWLKVIEETGLRAAAIHVLQRPARSESSRGRDVTSSEASAALWTRATVEAEAIPGDRLLIDRAALTADPSRVSVDVRRWLGARGMSGDVHFNGEMNALLHRMAQHRRMAPLRVDGSIGALAELTYRTLSPGDLAVRHDRPLSDAMRRRIHRALDARSVGDDADPAVRRMAELESALRAAVVARDLAASSLMRRSAAFDSLARQKADADRHISRLEIMIGEQTSELAAAHRSRSWRLTRPLRDVATQARRLLRRLGLRAIVLGLRPGQGVEVTRDGEFELAADASFTLDLPHELDRGLRPGWYRVALRGRDAQAVSSFELQVGTGAGFTTPRRTLPFAYFAERTTNLRLAVTAPSTRLRLHSVELFRVSMPAVARSLAARVRSNVLTMPGYALPRLRELRTLWREHGFEAMAERILHYNDVERGSFDQWVALYDEATPVRLQRYRSANAALAVRPRISILLPVHDPSERWLRRCLDSVLAQTYPDWELCIADDASTDARVRSVIARYSKRDTRIKAVRRDVRGHIAAATNSALALATGEFVAFLDHDDELAPWALYWIAATIAQTPDLCLIYSDEDKISEVGGRFDPYFKPDWNPELLRSQNYLCHLAAYRRTAVVEAGGLREGFEGSQDWDLALRVTERCRPEQIGHVPRILYHWRSVAGSRAGDAGAKTYATAAGQRAVSDALARAGVHATVDVTAEGYHRIRYQAPRPRPTVSIIIPTRNAVSFVRTCLESLFRHTAYDAYEVVLIDNQSDDPAALAYFAAAARRPNVRVLPYNAPFNFSAINNFGAEAALGDVLVLLNNDVEIIQRDWLDEMVSLAVQPQNGAVGVKLLYPDESIQHAGVVVGFGGVAGHIAVNEPRRFAGQMSRCLVAQNLTSVTAACLAVRKSVFEEAGGLDADNLSIAFNDVDFCLKIAALGYRNVWTPHVELFHHESASRGYENTREKQRRFERECRFMTTKWGERLMQDPAYSPNLDLDRQTFALAFPPRVSHI